MDIIEIVLANVDTGVSIILLVWLYDGLRKRHWKKSDEWDAERSELIDELFAWKRLAQNGNNDRPTPPEATG